MWTGNNLVLGLLFRERANLQSVSLKPDINDDDDNWLLFGALIEGNTTVDLYSLTVDLCSVPLIQQMAL